MKIDFDINHEVDPVLYVGLDLGRERTTVHAGRRGDLEAPLRLTFPTVICYDDRDGERPVLIGREAYDRRAELVNLDPLEAGNPCVLFDFARALRAVIDPRFEHQLWGVAHLPHGASPTRLRATRNIAHELFDRTHLVDGGPLAVEHFDARLKRHHSLCVDIGSNAVRITPIRSGVASDAFSFRGGALAVRKRFEVELRRRFPGFPISAGIVRELQERLGRLATDPVPDVVDGHGGSMEDISTLAARACEPLVEDVAYGISQALEGLTPRAVKAFVEDIRVVGGLAELPGLAVRLQRIIADHFGESARVHVTHEPSQAAAAGALRWAHMLPLREWRTPVFSFAS